MVFIVQFDIKSENYDVMKDELCTHFTSLHFTSLHINLKFSSSIPLVKMN